MWQNEKSDIRPRRINVLTYDLDNRSDVGQLGWILYDSRVHPTSPINEDIHRSEWGDLLKMNLAVLGDVGVVTEPWLCLCCRKSVSESDDAIICRFSSKFRKSKLLLRCGVTIATAVGGLFVPCSGSDTGESLLALKGGDFSELGDIVFCECCSR